MVKMVRDLEANCLGLNNFMEIIQVSVALLLSLSLKQNRKEYLSTETWGFFLDLNKRNCKIFNILPYS